MQTRLHPTIQIVRTFQKNIFVMGAKGQLLEICNVTDKANNVLVDGRTPSEARLFDLPNFTFECLL